MSEKSTVVKTTASLSTADEVTVTSSPSSGITLRNLAQDAI